MQEQTSHHCYTSGSQTLDSSRRFLPLTVSSCVPLRGVCQTLDSSRRSELGTSFCVSLSSGACQRSGSSHRSALGTSSCAPLHCGACQESICCQTCEACDEHHVARKSAPMQGAASILLSLEALFQKVLHLSLVGGESPKCGFHLRLPFDSSQFLRYRLCNIFWSVSHRS